MFEYAYVTSFRYEVDGAGNIRVDSQELSKLVQFPVLAQEIYHFVSDFAVSGTSYAVYVDIVKNVFRVKTSDRTVFTTD